MIFARLLNAKMKYTYLKTNSIYTGRKMAKNQGDFREGQREYCKICRLLGKSASEIKSELDTVYGENTLPYRTVARWVSYFKESRPSVKDEAVGVDQSWPPLKMMLPLSNLLFSKIHDIRWKR